MKTCSEIRHLVLGGVTQADMGILIGVSTKTIENWEQDYRSTPENMKGLFFIIDSIPDISVGLLLEVAVAKVYENIQSVKRLERLIKKLVKKTSVQNALFKTLSSNNNFN